MNQVGCACAYVYDCCKLLRVFSAPVYPDRRRRLSILSSSSSSFRLLFLFPSFSSCFSFFFYSTFPSPLSSVSSSTVPQRLHPPKDARHRRVIERLVHRIDDDDSLLNYTRSRGLRDALFGKFYSVTCSLGCTNNEG